MCQNPKDNLSWFFLQRDECIKHALQATGITTTNPKEAVTDNFLCTGGRTPNRDDIACTGMFPHMSLSISLSHLMGYLGFCEPFKIISLLQEELVTP